MCTRALVIGDPHVKMSNLTETDGLTKAIVREIEANDPDFVVVLGDTLHRHNIVDVQAHVKAVTMLKEIAKRKPLILLIGNHDLPSCASYLSSNHPFSALKSWKRTTVVDTKCVTFTFGGVTFAAVPYVPCGKLFKALDTNPQWRQARAVFMHQELLGSKMGKITSKKGDRWSSDLPYAISGHVHQHQVFEWGTYVGTPRHMSFSDSGDKALSLFTFKGGEMIEERIPTGLPLLLKVKTRFEDMSRVVIPTGAVAKIIVEGTRGQSLLFSTNDTVVRWRKSGAEVVFVTLPSSQVQERRCEGDTSDFIDLLMVEIAGDKAKESLLKRAMSLV